MNSIYVVTHKNFNYQQLDLDDCYKIIAVGSGIEAFRDNQNILSDNTGDNISEKNSNYCELTAKYWIWKNDKISDVIGLCHYRRYFTCSSLFSRNQKPISNSEINRYLQNYDAIVPRKTYSYRGAYCAYLDCGYEKDLDILEKVVIDLYPDYEEDYKKYFKNTAGNYPANMIITRRNIFFSYSEWLFHILMEVEKRVDISDYSIQEARIFGYMSERLLGVWIRHNRIKIKCLRIENIEIKDSFISILKNSRASGILKQIIFSLRNLGKK